MKSKKLTSLVLAGAMCAGMLAGCGDKETPETQPTTAPVDQDNTDNPDDTKEPAGLPPMTTENIELMYMHFDNATLVEYVAQKFMEKYPNIKVKTQDLGIDGYNDTLMNMISAKKIPDCFMVLGNCDFGLGQGLFGDFTEYWENDPENQNLMSSINDYKIGYYGTDKKLGTPIKAFPAALYADLNVFEVQNKQAPDPENWNWNALIDSFKTVTNAADQIYGFNRFYTPVTFYPIANDAASIGEFGWDGHRFHMDLWADGVNQLADLINSGYQAPIHDTDENEAWLGDREMWAAYSGKLGWQIDAYWTYLNLFDTPEYREKRLEWVPYSTPVNEAGTCFGVLDMGSISSSTKHPREAYELLKWMGWGVEGWKAKLEAYKTMTDPTGNPLFRQSMPCPITLDADIWEEYTQSFYPTAKERKYQSIEDMVNGGPLVTAEEDAAYGKYFDAYFKNVTRPVPFGDVQIPGFQAFIDGIYNNTVDGVGVEALVFDQGKNAKDYAAEMEAKALEYNQQALKTAKEVYALMGIELNYEVIEQ